MTSARERNPFPLTSTALQSSFRAMKASWGGRGLELSSAGHMLSTLGLEKPCWLGHFYLGPGIGEFRVDLFPIDRHFLKYYILSSAAPSKNIQIYQEVPNQAPLSSPYPDAPSIHSCFQLVPALPLKYRLGGLNLGSHQGFLGHIKKLNNCIFCFLKMQIF